ncbi:MAG: TraB/VirB10 family protein [Bdellovibrionales bacterium]|nr:TraB/VirB10 family protein [Bdellovibrionales bacterium]
MSMQQKIKDAIQLLQKDRKAQVVAAGIVCSILFVMFHEEPKRRRGPQPAFVVREQPADAIGATTAQEVYNDLQKVVVEELDKQREQMSQITHSIDETNKRIEENEIRTAEIFETIIKRVEQQRQAIPDYQTTQGTGDPLEATAEFPNEAVFDGDSLESFGEVSLGDEGTVAPPPIVAENPQNAVISPTDFIRVRFLAGVNAPTDGNPYPALLEVIGDVQSADGASLPLGSAKMLAAAQGQLVDSRVLLRLTQLTLRLPDGEMVTYPVDGYMVGEDGILGLPGVTIDPLGKVLGATAVTGFVQGAGSALSAAQTTTTTNTDGSSNSTLTGDALKFALGQGLSQPASLWTSIIRERVDAAVPVVQVYAGREATAVFTQRLVIPRLFEMIDGGEEDIYGGIGLD